MVFVHGIQMRSVERCMAQTVGRLHIPGAGRFLRPAQEADGVSLGAGQLQLLELPVHELIHQKVELLDGMSQTIARFDHPL